MPALGFLGLLLLTFQGGRLRFAYTLSDYIVSGLRFVLNLISLPLSLITTEEEGKLKGRSGAQPNRVEEDRPLFAGDPDRPTPDHHSGRPAGGGGSHFFQMA